MSVRYPQIEDLDAALPTSLFDRGAIPSEAAFLAGESCLAYRRQAFASAGLIDRRPRGCHRWFVRVVLPPDAREVVGQVCIKVPTDRTDQHRPAACGPSANQSERSIVLAAGRSRSA